MHILVVHHLKKPAHTCDNEQKMTKFVMIN